MKLEVLSSLMNLKDSARMIGKYEDIALAVYTDTFKYNNYFDILYTKLHNGDVFYKKNFNTEEKKKVCYIENLDFIQLVKL